MKTNIKFGARIISVFLLLVLTLVGCSNGNRKPKETASGTASSAAISTESDIPSQPTQATPKKRVALTYDDGPHNVHTTNIVDELAKYGAHATFFVVGNRVDGTEYNGRAGLEYAIAAGNEIGIHGYTHRNYYDSCSDAVYAAELSKTLNAIWGVSPSTPVTLMRPVGGRISADRVENSEYAVMMWSVDSEDWRYKYSSSESASVKEENLSVIVDNVLSSVTDGSIILMHDIYASTYDATVIILERLYADGYEVVTVSELLGDELMSGVKFYSK